jgi:hypothetical protein
MKKLTLRSVQVAMVAFSALALAQQAGAEHEHHARHRSPPAEALQACASLKAGAACAFTLHGDNLTGTCEAPPDASALACRPTRPPGAQGQHRGPPKESLEACASSSTNAACSFTLGEKALNGTCAAPPDGGKGPLACRPAGAGPFGHHGPPAQALAACANLSAAAACSFAHGDQHVSGTCVTGRHGNELICHPADMPPPPNE